jgi:hypothetical protein
VAGKYVYATGSSEIAAVMHYLFSDQSRLTYISEELKGDDFVSLLTNHEAKYGDFHDHQKPCLDELIEWGILKKTSKRLIFQSPRQIFVLKNLFQTEALSYYHYSVEGRIEIDTMISRGWLVREGALLTTSEARYFAYYLNQEHSSNGYDLRNTYLHGSLSSEDKADEGKHYEAYLIALRLLIALVIKIDDDFSIKRGFLGGT